MNPLGYIPLMDYKQRHEELIKMAAQYRLVAEALKAEKPKTRSTPNIPALIGKELANLGFGLEVRFGDQPDANPTLNQQSNPGGGS
jgi:hypothetical protein